MQKRITDDRGWYCICGYMTYHLPHFMDHLEECTDKRTDKIRNEVEKLKSP